MQRDPLQLDDSLHFSSAGLVAGFGVPDALDLRDIAFISGTTVERQSWWHPQEPICDEWWADVLADPRARKRERRTDLAVKQAFYRLADEKRETILVACSKCDWRAAFSRDAAFCRKNTETDANRMSG